MTAELISVGTELLMGNIVNTNAAYLAEQCTLLGLNVYFQTVVGDNQGRLEETLRLALSRAEVVILTGGLGPTMDDLTKETAAGLLGFSLVEDGNTMERLREFANARRFTLTKNNFKQAMVPEGAMVLENDNGTAPGIIMEKDGKYVILLPGPPHEMCAMFEGKVFPYLMGLQQETIYSETLKIIGIGESAAETMVEDLIKSQSNPTIAPYAKEGEVHLRLSARAADQERAAALIRPVKEEICRRFGEHIFTDREEEALEDVIVKLLTEHGLTVATAESCTGGLVAGRLVNAGGASACFKEGYITYSNEAKGKLLQVSGETLRQYGAVSQETAREMAVGAAKAAGADVAVAVTGIAGPGGGTAEKPVGLVYIGCYFRGKIAVERFQFGGSRERIRRFSVTNALILLRKIILENL